MHEAGVEKTEEERLPPPPFALHALSMHFALKIHVLPLPLTSILMHLATFVVLTCGVVMMIAPSTCVLLKYWTIDRCSSDVPGGVSTTR